jgi:flagellar hook protein FlgE
MYSGVAGLRNHQLRMDVLSNNISNVNTYGYKASRATFVDMFSQTLSAASAPNASGTLGGINPRQVGLGSASSAIDVIHTSGAFQSTDRALDLAIVDEGFFTVKDGDEFFYTRAGNFYIDAFGYLIDAGGRYLMGLMLVDEMAWENDDLMETSVSERVMEDERIVWNQGEDGDGTYQDIIRAGEDEPPTPVYGNRVDGDFEDDRMEAFGRIVIPTYYRNIAITESGIVQATDEDGIVVEIAVIATATFQNAGGLTKMGDNLYKESPNSGVPGYLFPGLGPNGPLKPGGLEMSNVDLANEFTSMIVTQRGYQANSRIITVSDTMLEELVNLKR